MSNGIAIAALPRVPAVRLAQTEDPFLIEVYAPVETATVAEAVSQSAVIAEQAAIAAVAPLLASTPTELDTFLEAFNRFVASESAAAALNALVAGLRGDFDEHAEDAANPHAVTKAQVGLGSVANLSPAELLASPGLTGSPTAPTAAAASNTSQVATTAFVRLAVAYVFQQPGVLAALLPNTPPVASGVPWLNGGVVTITP